MNRFTILTLMASPFLLSSCALGVAAGAGAAVGVASVQEGGVSRAASDAYIQTQINDLWFRYNVDMFSKLDLTINQGRVLITGVVQDPKHRVEAVRLAWQPKGVVQVINEIKVANSEGIVGFAKDAWISTRLRTALMLDSEIESLNYSIDTVQGSVYLMGFAQDQAELDRAIQKARTIANVRSVVSYVKLVGAPEATGGSRSQQQSDRGMQASEVDFSQEYSDTSSASPGGAAVAPVATGEPIDWNDGVSGY